MGFVGGSVGSRAGGFDDGFLGQAEDSFICWIFPRFVLSYILLCLSRLLKWMAQPEMPSRWDVQGALVDPECCNRCDLYSAVILFLLFFAPVCLQPVRPTWGLKGSLQRVSSAKLSL